MRILIVSWTFAPRNAIGAVRATRTAEELLRMGHDVRVLSARTETGVGRLETTFPDTYVTRTKWMDVNALAKRSVSEETPTLANAGSGQLKARLARAYAATINFPDPAVGWLVPAVRAGTKLVSVWRPDVIFATSPPSSSLLVAGHLARRHQLPWVADYRDPWTDNPYSNLPRWRRRLDEKLESKTLAGVSAVTTIGPTLARELSERLRVGATAVMNGYDPSDVPTLGQPPERGSARLTLRHMGSIYPGRRDPRPLLEALTLVPHLHDHLLIEFYGNKLHYVRDAVDSQGLGHVVKVREPVARDRSLELQALSDALILLTWDSPLERGTLPAKMFEYIGCRRPILLVGSEDGDAADIIRNNNLGVVRRSPKLIAKHLAAWVGQFQESGILLPNDPTVVSSFRRGAQTQILADILEQVCDEQQLARIATKPRSLVVRKGA